MIHHNNNGREFLLVDVPEWYDGPIIVHFGQTQALSNCSGLDAIFPLPPGEWEIVGRGDELTQGQAKEIVKEAYSTDTHIILNYHDYKQGLRLSASPLRSFETLLESHSLTPANTLVLKRKSDG